LDAAAAVSEDLLQERQADAIAVAAGGRGGWRRLLAAERRAEAFMALGLGRDGAAVRWWGSYI
jgi:nucleotide-binding universal stress UspA family protein